MNEQMSFLKNVIASARTGNDAAVTLLRAVCRKAADAAPDGDLLAIAQFLYDLRQDAARKYVASN